MTSGAMKPLTGKRFPRRSKTTDYLVEHDELHFNVLNENVINSFLDS